MFSRNGSTPISSMDSIVSWSTPAAPRFAFTRFHASRRTSPLQIRSYKAWNRLVLLRLAHTYSLRWSSRTLVFRVVGSCDHALALTSISSVIEAGPLPSSVFPRLPRYYKPLGHPPDSRAISAFNLIRSVFARRRLPGRASPVPTPPLKTCRRPYPGEIQHTLRIYPRAVCCLHHDKSGSALPCTFRLII